MQNIKTEVKENKLLIEIDLSEDHGPSKSGKSITIASTKGNIKMKDEREGDFILGVNCYRPVPNNKESS